MNVSPVQLSKAGPGSSRSTALVARIGILMGIAVLLACGFLSGCLGRGMVTTHGSVLQTRIDKIDMPGALISSKQQYQIKAYVRYDNNGQTQEAWMPASDKLHSRLPLEVMLARNPRTCLVYWPAKYPERPRCGIER